MTGLKTMGFENKILKCLKLCHLPSDVKDLIVDYSNDFIIAFYSKCSPFLVDKLFKIFIKECHLFYTYSSDELDSKMDYYDLFKYHYINSNDIELLLYIYAKYEQGIINEYCGENFFPSFLFNGSISCMMVLNDFGMTLDENVMYCGIRNEQLESITFLSTYLPLQAEDLCVAVKSLKTVEFLHNASCPTDSDVFDFACSHGNLNVLKFLNSKDYPMDIFCYRTVVRHNHVHLLDWLFLESKVEPDTDLLLYAIASGSLDCMNIVMNYLEALPIEDTTYGQLAARFNTTDALNFLKSKGYVVKDVAFSTALEYKRTDLYKWFYDEYKGSSSMLYVRVFKTNDIPTIEYFINLGLPINYLLAASALNNENISVFKYIYAIGVPYHYLCHKAAELLPEGIFKSYALDYYRAEEYKAQQLLRSGLPTDAELFKKEDKVKVDLFLKVHDLISEGKLDIAERLIGNTL